MQNSKQFLNQSGFLPTISFKDGKPHTVVLIADKLDQITDQVSKQVKYGVKYKVTEAGQVKTFFTTSEALISKLSEIKEGVTVRIQSIGKSINGKFITSYDVQVIGEKSDFQKQIEDIPVVEDTLNLGKNILKEEPETYGDEQEISQGDEPSSDF